MTCSCLNNEDYIVLNEITIMMLVFFLYSLGSFTMTSFTV